MRLFKDNPIPQPMKPTKFVSTFLAFAACSFSSFAHTAQAATITWNNSPGAGDYNVATNWDTGTVPGALDAADIVKINNTGTSLGGTTITYKAGDNYSIASLDLAAAAGQDNNRPVFNQAGGTLGIGTLRVGLPSSGSSKSPEYHISGGILNLTSALSFGNGSAIKFLASGGTVNYSGSTWALGYNGVAHELTLTNNAVYSHNTANQITLGNNAGGIAKVTLSNTASFVSRDLSPAANLSTILVGNNGSLGNFITLNDNSSFSVPAATLALGQFISGSTSPGTAAGTLTVNGSSYFKAKTIKTGGNNAVNPQWGVVNLNGGTIEAESIQVGSSSTVASATRNVVNANGGTIKSTIDNSNFFAGVYVNVLTNGLTFNTGEKYVAITNALAGAGGLTKQGPGTLTLSSNALSYAGNTIVSEGNLSLTNGTLSDTANVSIATGENTHLDLSHGLEDAIGSLTLGGVVKPNGVYGSTSSAAPLANQSDAYFSGTGTVRVGPPASSPRDLTWDGSVNQAWSNFAEDTNFLQGATPTAFKPFDNVTFGNVTDPDEFTTRRNVFIYGAVQPTSITFSNDTGFDYILSGGIIGGATGIVKNGTGSATLGSPNSYFGAIAINAGRLILGDSKGFGNTSGITIGNLAQADINGKMPGINYTYTLAGTGPNGVGSGQIVNSGIDVVGNGGVGAVTLTADASIGNDGNRFDIGSGGGALTGNSHTLTKVGTNGMAFRGSASGSPVHIIVAGGSIWAEGTDAFGGATGTLTAKSGTRVGTYGVRTINTPVTLESGSGINNLGTGKATWSSPLSVSGAISLDSGGTVADQVEITGTVTGTADITKGGTASITVTHPTWVGNTTVSGGTLTLSNAELADSGSVSIAATAILDLPHGLEDSVATLFIDGVQMAAGVYGATGNLSAGFTTDRLTGAGKLKVLTGPSAGGGFAAWADAAITNPAYAALKGRQDDPDTDGFTNLQEFVFGTDPQTNTGSLTQITGSGASLVIRWNQRDSGATYQLQQSATLAENPWPASELVPTNSADQTGVSTGYTRKETAIPVDSARKFLRVQGAEN
jgi:autotransporter-associated beta strand protein